MQHLQYGNYDIRYMVYVRKMADIKYIINFFQEAIKLSVSLMGHHSAVARQLSPARAMFLNFKRRLKKKHKAEVFQKAP